MIRFAELISEPTTSKSPSNLASWYTPGLSDALGDRLLMFDNSTASPLELLRFKRDLSDSAIFEAALRARVQELAGFEHAAFGTVRMVTRIGDDNGLVLVSNQVLGQRLSEVLHKARGPGLAEALIRRLAPALAALHERGPGIAHGLVTPERIVITPDGGLVLIEHVLGSALQALQLPSQVLRSTFGLAIQAGDQNPALDARLDVLELGHMALSLVVGRRTDTPRQPDEVAALIDEIGRTARAPRHLQLWLERALLPGASTFGSARDAADALADWTPEHVIEAESESRSRLLLTPVFGKPSRPREEAAIDARTEPLVFPQSSAFAEPVQTEDDAVEARRRYPGLVRGLIALSAVQAAIIVLLLVNRSAPAPTTVTAASEPAVAAASSPVAPPVARPAGPASPAQAQPTRPSIGQTATDASPARALFAPAVLAKGELAVTSEPAGAVVTIDGTRHGVTPLNLALASGEHAVEIAAGDHVARQTVTIESGRTIVARAEVPSTTVFIVAQPWANVWIDGQAFGRTPVADIKLAAGPHEVVLRHPDFGERRQSIDSKPDEPVRLAVNLRDE